MATVLRVKRRRGEDPADNLVISCKRPRSSQPDAASTDDTLKNVFRFAGTISEKKRSVVQHIIRDAIKRQKLDRQWQYQHQRSAVAECPVKLQKRSPAAHQYQLVPAQGDSRDAHRLAPSQDQSQGTCHPDDADQEARSQSSPAGGDRRQEGAPSAAAANNVSDVLVTGAAAAMGNQKPFLVYDIVKDRVPELMDLAHDMPGPDPAKPSEITCNSVPLIRERVAPSADDDYEYDLYYANDAEALDWRQLEQELTIEAFDERYEFGDYRDGLGEADEDEDSNDEGNWRNDYPDQDPHYYDAPQSSSDDEFADDHECDAAMGHGVNIERDIADFFQDKVKIASTAEHEVYSSAEDEDGKK